MYVLSKNFWLGILLRVLVVLLIVSPIVLGFFLGIGYCQLG